MPERFERSLYQHKAGMNSSSSTPSAWPEGSNSTGMEFIYGRRLTVLVSYPVPAARASTARLILISSRIPFRDVGAYEKSPVRGCGFPGYNARTSLLGSPQKAYLQDTAPARYLGLKLSVHTPKSVSPTRPVPNDKLESPVSVILLWRRYAYI